MLELKDVTVGYGRTSVVHDVSLTIEPGGSTSIMGHNGAGKTTLLRAVVGLLTPTSGTIRFDGHDITRWRPSRRVKVGLGYVPQGQQSFGQMTTMENLQLVADGRRRGPELVAEALDTFPALVGLKDRRAGLLSGGQRQQLSIARTLITEPRMLILDEPTEGIQPNVVTEIEGVITALTQRGDLSVLLVEQHVGFALRAADTYHVLESGRVTSSGAGGPAAIDDVRAAMAV